MICLIHVLQEISLFCFYKHYSHSGTNFLSPAAKIYQNRQGNGGHAHNPCHSQTFVPPLTPSAL